MQELAERITFYPGCGDMGTNPVDRQQQQRKDDPFPQFGDVEYIFQACDQGLNHLSLAACGLDFI